MTTTRWIVVIGLVGIFIFAKAWVIRHPKGALALIIGAVLLILTEPTAIGNCGQNLCQPNQ